MNMPVKKGYRRQTGQPNIMSRSWEGLDPNYLSSQGGKVDNRASHKPLFQPQIQKLSAPA